MLLRVMTWALLGSVVFASVGCSGAITPDDERIDAPSRGDGRDVVVSKAPSSDQGTNDTPSPTPKTCDGESFSAFGLPTVPSDEFGARWDATRTTLFSTRQTASGRVFFTATSYGSLEGKAIPITDPIGNIEYPTVTADGESLYFGGQSGSDWQIFVAKKENGVFGAATPVPFNSAKQDIQPYVVGNAIYWAQGDEPQRSINRYDLATKTIDRNVLELVAKLWNPVVTPDELTIYFAWNREGNDQPALVHVATRADKNARFGPPRRVEAVPPNSGPTWVSPDKCELLFETRENGKRVMRLARAK